MGFSSRRTSKCGLLTPVCVSNELLRSPTALCLQPFERTAPAHGLWKRLEKGASFLWIRVHESMQRESQHCNREEISEVPTKYAQKNEWKKTFNAAGLRR